MGGDTSPEQLYALRWNDHESSILSSFRHLRDEEDFVDVTLACEGCSFTAHKVVLSACSPYFKNLLKANPCTHPIVILKDVPKKDMENLLRFMYNGEVNIGQEHLAEFLKTAQMLQVRGLVELESKVQQQPTSQKLTPQGASLTWSTERTDSLADRDQSPPVKRSRQDNQDNQGAFTPRVRSPSRGNNGDTQDTLLGQALEGGPTLHTPAKGNSDSSLLEQTTGEDSSSDTQMSEQDREVKTEVPDYQMEDHHHYSTNGSGLMDPSRAPSFPGAALLNLSGLPGLLPGTSSLNDFTDASSRSCGPGGLPLRTTVGGQLDLSSTSSSGVGAVNVKYECPLCEQVLPSINAARLHIDEHYPRDSPYCPVTDCAKRFSHPNSVRNHMRAKHSRQWELMKQMKWST